MMTAMVSRMSLTSVPTPLKVRRLMPVGAPIQMVMAWTDGADQCPLTAKAIRPMRIAIRGDVCTDTDDDVMALRTVLTTAH